MSSRPSFDHLGAIYRAGVALVAVAVLVSTAGCGSRASDEDIAAALGAAAPPASPASGQPGSEVPAGVVAAPAAGTASGSTTADSVTAPAEGVATAPAGGDAATDKTKARPGQPGQVASPTVANKSVVKVGTLGAFSGVLGAVTGSAPKVLGAWVAYTNAHGGLNGHPVKLIVADDQADPATALTLAKRLVESDGVIAFVGNVNLFGFVQIEQYLRQKNIPMVGGDGVDPGWFTSPITFPVSPPASVQVIKGIKKFVDEGSRKIGVLYCLEVSALCTYLYDQAKSSEVGQYIEQSYQVSLVAPSYTSQCLRMKQAGLEVVYLLMDTAGAARVSQDCATQGYKPKLILAALDATKDMPAIPSLGEAFIPGATISPGATGVPALRKYHDVMAVYGPTIGDSGFGMQAWAAGELLGLTGKDLPDSPTAGDLFAGLWKIQNQTLGGLTVPFTFAKGKPAEVKQCVFIWGTADGSFTAPQGTKLAC